MMFGDGAQAAAQIADLMQNFAKSVNTNPGAPTGFLPVDIEEQESQYVLIADIPGLSKADLKVFLHSMSWPKSCC